jgi:apolipoprotein D and lipocalin family protein
MVRVPDPRGSRHTAALCGLAAAITLSACATETPPLATAESLDIPRYLGTWYEIARYEAPFQEGCTATTATYSLRDDGQLRVLNRCRMDSLNGPLREAEGRARVIGEPGSPKLEVTFFWPFWADYWVIGLDPDYTWSVVGEPRRRYLWILSRTPDLPAGDEATILGLLEARGYDPSGLLYTEHDT